MDKLTAFFKRHWRGIITTAAFLAFDVVMLLVVHPLIANIEDFNTRFFIVVLLAYVHCDRAFILDYHADSNKMLQKQSRKAGEPQCLKY